MQVDLSTVRFLHVAPEWPLFRKFRSNANYVGGDIITRRNRNSHVDITAIQYPEASFDVVMANHVLEHVRHDLTAMTECFRVLSPNGLAVFSVPIDGRQKTWEPPEDMDPKEVERLCGWDHVRLYGLDIADRLSGVGFEVRAEIANSDEIAKYSLLSTDVIFVCQKPSSEMRRVS